MINIGVVVFFQNDLEIKLTKRLEKIKAISLAVDFEQLSTFANNIRHIDQVYRDQGILSPSARREEISNIGPFSLSEIGTFSANSASSYSSRLESILRTFVEPEPSTKGKIKKRTRLFSDMKRILREEKILAKSNEGLESHRLVTGFELDNGLVADLVLKNGSFHVIETVDADGGLEAIRKMISGIAMSALVLERARMRFGNEHTRARIVYSASSVLEAAARPSLEAAEHQGTELINWSSKDDQLKFLTTMTSLAIPIESEQKKKILISRNETFLH